MGGLLVGGLELWGMVSMFSLVVVGLDCSVCGLLYLVAFDMLVAGCLDLIISVGYFLGLLFITCLLWLC